MKIDLTTKENCYLIEFKRSRGNISKEKLQSHFTGDLKSIRETLKSIEKKGYLKRSMNSWRSV